MDCYLTLALPSNYFNIILAPFFVFHSPFITISDDGEIVFLVWFPLAIYSYYSAFFYF